MDVFPGPCFEDIVHKLTGLEGKIQCYEPQVKASPHPVYYAIEEVILDVEEVITEKDIMLVVHILLKEEVSHNIMVKEHRGTLSPVTINDLPVRYVEIMVIHHTNVTRDLMRTLRLMILLHRRMSSLPQIMKDSLELSGTQTMASPVMSPVMLTILILHMSMMVHIK